MAFSTRRGRPKVIRHDKDTGTKELKEKSAKGWTEEPADLCLRRQLITLEQHSAAIHLRWLHTLRFGVTSARAVDPQDLGGRELKSRDAAWQAAREKDYLLAIEVLEKANAKHVVLNTCIYNRMPGFLLHPSHHRKQKTAVSQRDSLEVLCEGLTLLADMWQRGKRFSKQSSIVR